MIAFLVILIPAVLVLLAIYLFRIKTGTGMYHSVQLKTINAIECLLPQTQCGKCHYPGCRPYAEAIATGNADINLCTPGGEATVHELAMLLGTDSKPMATGHKVEDLAKVALIDEDLCIGCVKCINACPVDAIMGASKLMHTVIKTYCTGCELCIAPCPVDCISMVPIRVKTKAWVWSKPDSVS
jgi:electron transport complex protein RnfB